MLRKKLSAKALVVVLDFIGVLFIGVGLYLQFNGGLVSDLPGQLSEKLPMALIIFGALLMVPMIGYILNSAGKSKARRSHKKPRGMD